MAHNIDQTNGRYNIAFMGERKDIWHRHGQQMQAGMTIEQWADKAGLSWHAIKSSAYVDNGTCGVIALNPVPGHIFVTRSDTGRVLGHATDRYQPHQPAEVLDWFRRYIEVDDRFQLDVAGSLKGGEIIWATATYRDPLEVAGDKHVARVLMSTTFDGSGATINQGTMTRVVCNNTLNVALADRKAVVRTRHNTTFDAARVGKELAQIASGFTAYKKMGDAMARVELQKEDVSRFFKSLLDIPFETKQEDISARKMNQFRELGDAYRASTDEGASGAWAALQAITRYVDHDRSTKGADKAEGRFVSAQFGSGAGMKSKAVELLLARMEATLAADPAPVPASANLLATMEQKLATA